MAKVLVLATSKKTKGGITSVVSAYEGTSMWKEWNCKWIETHSDTSFYCKLFYFTRSLILFIIHINYYSIVHMHISEPSSAIRKSIFIFFTKLFKKKLIVHFHSFSVNTTINSRYKWVYSYVFRKSDATIVLSEYWEREISKTFQNKKNVKVLYNPCELPKSTKKYTKKNIILYAGSLNKRKGYADLIISFSLISSKFPDWKLIFAGDGEIEKAKFLAIENNVFDQIEFLGWVDGNRKDKAFQEAKFFCLPSYAEGFPMSVIDAWAYQLPTVVTPVGGLPDIIEDGKNSLVFNPGNVKKLSECLEILILNKDLRNILSFNSSKLNHNYFSIDKITNQLSGIYDQLAKE